MTNQPAISNPGSQGRPQARDRSSADVYRKVAEALSVDNNLWRQLDRWVNEGGAVGDGSAPSPKT